MQGSPLIEVADTNGQNADADLQAKQEARRRLGGAIELRRRDNQPVTPPEETQPQTTAPTNPNEVPKPPADQTPPQNYAVPRPPQ
jgi:hypothetical protein